MVNQGVTLMMMLSLMCSTVLRTCRADKAVMASSGFQADVKAFQKHLAAKHLIYQHQHNKQMSCSAMAQLLSNTLYYKRFPYHACNVLGGLDREGNNCCRQLLDSDDIHYMLGALKTLGLCVEEDKVNKRAVVEGCSGRFPLSNESSDEVQLFLGHAGTAMRPLIAEVVAAGGHSRFV